MAEKRTAKLWLSKIDQYDAKTSDEARLRNKLLHRLMHMCKNMWISEPPADIIDLKQIMVTKKIYYKYSFCIRFFPLANIFS